MYDTDHYVTTLRRLHALALNGHWRELIKAVEAELEVIDLYRQANKNQDLTG